MKPNLMKITLETAHSLYHDGVAVVVEDGRAHLEEEDG